MVNWMVAIGQKLIPLVEQMRADALAADVLHADETTVQVLKEPDRRPDQKSYMWVQSTGTGPPVVVYHYAPGRSAEVVNHLFSDYRGTLVTDGYAAYGNLAHASHAGCWAHARRKFNDALKVQKGKRTGKAQVGFNAIQKLFALEKQWAKLSPEERLEQRQQLSRPVIDELATWLEKSLPTIAPKSQLGRAMVYLHKQWDKLNVFLESGDVPIHNNQAENKIRPFVIGRKNWMFNDSMNGAASSAAIYSIIETAKANDLNPDMYLRWLFNVLPNTDTTNTEALRALTPYGVDPDMIVQSLADRAPGG
jgi:transposase